MSDSETIEEVLAEMESQAADIEKDDLAPDSWDHGYCVAAGAYAKRLREAMERRP